MLTRNRGLALLVVAGLIVACILGFINRPGTTTTEKEKVQKDITSTVREIKRPDGTVEIVTEVRDRSTENRSAKSTTVPVEPVKYIISLTAAVSPDKWKPTYGVQLQAPVFGRIVVGAAVNTEKQLMATIGWGFR